MTLVSIEDWRLKKKKEKKVYANVSSSWMKRLMVKTVLLGKRMSIRPKAKIDDLSGLECCGLKMEER